MTDYISRADAICEVLVNDGIDNIVDRINALPSAETVSREEYEETDGVVTIEKQNANEVGEIKHIVIHSPNYTRYFYNESMPLPSADAVQGERGHMMIDGNKLMLALSEWWYSSFGLEETEESKAIHKVMDEVERYVDHEKSADYWIPCSERLPKAEDMYQIPEQRYLCQLEAHGERKFCVLSRLKGAVSPFWDWYGIAVYDSEVIAWMPLPKPYREDGEI